VGSVQNLVGDMLEAAIAPGSDLNDKVKIISKIKSKIIKKQQNLEFLMKVKADLTPKNAQPGSTFEEYQQKGT